MAGATSPVEREKRRKRADDDAAGPAPAPVVPGPSRQPSDAALVRAAQRDPLAFAPLYQRYVTPVYRYCFRQTSDPEAAADLTAQIFTKALEALPRFHLRGDAEEPGTATVRSWLFAIAHNAIVDVRRRDRPTRSLDAVPDPARSTAPATSSGELADPGIGPEELAVHRDELGRLIAVLGRLPDSQRQIIELRLAGQEASLAAPEKGVSTKSVAPSTTKARRGVNPNMSSF